MGGIEPEHGIGQRPIRQHLRAARAERSPASSASWGGLLVTNKALCH